MMELNVNALADEDGNIPSIRTPLGVRITSKDGSAEGSASRTALRLVIVLFYTFVAGKDYQNVLSTVYFRPSHSNVVVLQIIILDDDLQEGEERFTVELSAFDVSVVLVNSVAEFVIMDDDRIGKSTSVYRCTLY